MNYTYTPQGVCSSEITVELDGKTIKKVEIVDGCAGNSLGIAKLIEGMNVYEAIKRLKGTRCGYRDTSCPDQLAIALEEALEEVTNERFV